MRTAEEVPTLLSYECRTKATDPSATRAFMRYWRPLSPFIGVVLRAQLRTVESTLEEDLPQWMSNRSAFRSSIPTDR